jgi:eukaryotic-like serine/threonine-protein kinase
MPDTGPVIGGRLAHYRVLEHLGSGGAGDVYRAEDTRLRRIVALKMLRAEEAGGDASRRLLAEARAASALNHPNIAVLYEAGEAEHEGRRVAFIAMEYVEGSTLAAVAARARLDLDRILDITGQIADALAEAHAHGLVHRDLKPANVMVTSSGRIKVLDFGVAQHRAAAAAHDDETRTGILSGERGWFVGTLPYVAPEQATGRDVDGRADIFSLGVVLYELAVGRPPFGGDNAAQMLEAILRGDVPPFPDADRDARLPPIEQLVRRMLARDPARRIDRAEDVREALAAIRSGGRLPDPIDPASDANALAVADFVNISGSPEDDWLGTGIAETLTADAGQLEGVSVIPRQRVSALIRTLGQQTGEQGDRLLLQAGRELRARWIVRGAFQRSGDAIRVTASVTDLASGQPVGTAKVDGRLQAVFELQDRLVRELAGALRAAVAPTTIASPETEVVEAYEAFSRGVLNRRAETFETLDRAVWLFERAVAIDPSYARAHVELGAAYATKASYLSMPELQERAVSSLRRAIDLQPRSARAWRELGSVLMEMGQDTEGIAAIRRALTIEPDDASTCGTMGRALFIGYARFGEAADWFTRALERNPKGGWYALQLAHCAALVRDFERGEEAARRALELQEAFLSGREGLFIAGAYIRAGHLAALQGRDAAAVSYYERELDFLVRTDHALRNRILVELNARLGAAYLRLGDAHKAQAVFDVALEGFERRVRLGADDPFTRYYAAAVHALRGDAEPALAFLERALSQQRAFTIARARIEPEFDGLRHDARFRRLVA